MNPAAAHEPPLGKLRLGFVSVIRPAFKGDAAAAAHASREQLERLGQLHGFDLAVANAQRGEHGVPAGLPHFSVHDSASAERAAAELRAAQLDLLLVQHTTFATGEVLAPLLRLGVRVGLWALPEVAAGEAYRGPLPFNSLCGVNMTLSYLGAPEVATGEAKWFYGHADSEWFQARLRVTLAALRGLRALEHARVLQIGGTAPGFYGLNEELALSGPLVDTLPLADFLRRVAAVDARRAEAHAQAQAAGEPSEVSAEQMVRAARIELALGDLASEGAYQALAVRCWPELPDSCGSVACSAMGNLSRSVPAACEGDVVGALSMLVMQAVSERPAVLMDLSALDEQAQALMFWHCGNAPREWAAGGSSRLTTHFNLDGVGVVRDMELVPGPASGFRFVGERSALVLGGTFGPGQRGTFDGVSGWLHDASWNGQPLSAGDLVANVLDRRLAHHFAFGHGEHTLALQELCAWLGRAPLEPLVGTHALRPLRQ